MHLPTVTSGVPTVEVVVQPLDRTGCQNANAAATRILAPAPTSAAGTIGTGSLTSAARPPSRRLFDTVSTAVLSVQFQCAVQLMASVLIVALPVFIRPIAFPSACLTATFAVAGCVIVSPDNNVGTRLLGAALLIGSMAWGSLLGGCALSLAHLAPPGAGRVAVMLVLGSLLLALLAVNRVGARPAYLWVVGALSVLGVGMVLLMGHRLERLEDVWRLAVGPLLLSVVVGSVVSALVAVVVLPSYACDELRLKVAQALRGTGHALTGYASCAFLPEEGGEGLQAAHGASAPAAAPAPSSTTSNGAWRWSPGPSAFDNHDGAQAKPEGELQLSGRRTSASGTTPFCGASQLLPQPHAHPLQQPQQAWTASSDEPKRAAGRGGDAASAGGAAALGQAAGGGQMLPQRSGRAAEIAAAAVAAVSAAPTSGGFAAFLHSIAAAAAAAAAGAGVSPGPPVARITSRTPLLSHFEEQMSRRHASADGGGTRTSLELVDGDTYDEEAILEFVQQMASPPNPPPPPAKQQQRRSRTSLPPSASRTSLPPSASRGSLWSFGRRTQAESDADAAASSSDSDSDPGQRPSDSGAADRGALQPAGGSSWASLARTMHGPAITSLRPLLDRARTCMGSASLEPPFLVAAPCSAAAWGRVLACADTLLTRVAALQGVVEERKQVAGDASLRVFFGLDIVPRFRQAFALVAATCAGLADAIERRTRAGRRASSAAGPQLRSAAGELGSSWRGMQEALRADMGEAFSRHWQRVRSADKAFLHIMDAQRVRALMFLWTFTTAIIESAEQLEQAVADALPPPTTTPLPGAEGVAAPTPGTGAGTAAPSPGANAGDAAAGGGDAEAPAPQDQRPARAALQPKPPTDVPPPYAWAQHLLMVCAGLPLLFGLHHTLLHQLPGLAAPEARRALLSSRIFAAGVKYWVSVCCVLLLILGLSERPDTQQVQHYLPTYAFIAACLAMSERVEATVSKVLYWVVGTALGGVLGYLVMMDAHLADNPYALSAVIGAYTFTVGMLSGTMLRVGMVLVLMTFNSLVLCQYKGCCGATGRADFFGARVLAVALGACIPILITNIIMPWFTSDWALEVMGGTFREGVALVRQLYTDFYHEAADIHGGVMGVEATRALRAKYGEPPKCAPAQPEEQPVGAGAPRAGAPQPAGPPQPPLQARVAAPLVGVQVALAKDSVLWTRGVLATPKVVPAVLQAQLVLLDRLSALALVVTSPMGVHGHFSGWAFEHIVVPLTPEMMATLAAMDAVASATARLLSCRDKRQANDARESIAAAIEELEHIRVQVRRHVMSMRHAFFHGVRHSDAERLPHLTHPDDAVRVYSFIYAWSQVMDKATALARTALQHNQGSKAATSERAGAWLR